MARPCFRTHILSLLWELGMYQWLTTTNWALNVSFSFTGQAWVFIWLVPCPWARSSFKQRPRFYPERACVPSTHIPKPVLLFSHQVVSDSLQPQELKHARLLCPWDSPGNNTGVGCHFFLQRIFLTQESNLGLLYWRQILYWLNYEDSLDFRIVTPLNLDKLETVCEFIIVLNTTAHS